MSILKAGTRCVIVGGCPENIGLVVEVVEHLGVYDGRSDAYCIRTISGRKYHQLWRGNDLQRVSSDECITDRHKLRPLVEPKYKVAVQQIESPVPSGVAA
jgi:hypothetical protein